MYVDESDKRLTSYDMIIGRDLLTELGIDLMFSLRRDKMGTSKCTYERSCNVLPSK
jgi:hypothetical protein